MRINTNAYWIIVDTDQPIGRDVFLNCKEIQVTVPDQTTAVVWKWKLHRKRTKEIGDGMEILLGFSRNPYEIQPDMPAVLRWLSLRQEFNEETGVWETYLYRFPKDEDAIGTINSILYAYKADAEVLQKGRFVVVWGKGIVYEALDAAQIAAWWIETLISFFFGIMLWYGSYTQGSISVHLPVTWAMGRYDELLTLLLDRLAAYGIFMTADRQQAKIGHVLQISCKDRELLYLFGKRLNINTTDSTDTADSSDIWGSASEISQLYQQKYLHFDHSEVIADFSSYSVLKKRTK